MKNIQWYKYQNVKYKYWNMKNQSFCFLKHYDKSICFNLHFGPCGLLIIFWTDATVTVHGSSNVSPWETVLLTALLALAEIAELLEFAILVESLVFAILVELLAFAAIVILLAFVTEFHNVKSDFASLFRCALFFFQVFLCELILFDGTKGGFFFYLFSFALSFNLAL